MLRPVSHALVFDVARVRNCQLCLVALVVASH